MFDFEKLSVYDQARMFVKDVLYFLFQRGTGLDPFVRDQLKRSAISISLNIAEGAGRRTSADKRRFYTMARSSVFESVAALQILLDQEELPSELYDSLYGRAEELSKMLLGLIRALS